MTKKKQPVITFSNPKHITDGIDVLFIGYITDNKAIGTVGPVYDVIEPFICLEFKYGEWCITKDYDHTIYQPLKDFIYSDLDSAKEGLVNLCNDIEEDIKFQRYMMPHWVEERKQTIEQYKKVLNRLNLINVSKFDLIMTPINIQNLDGYAINKLDSVDKLKINKPNTSNKPIRPPKNSLGEKHVCPICGRHVVHQSTQALTLSKDNYIKQYPRIAYKHTIDEEGNVIYTCKKCYDAYQKDIQKQQKLYLQEREQLIVMFNRQMSELNEKHIKLLKHIGGNIYTKQKYLKKGKGMYIKSN